MFDVFAVTFERGVFFALLCIIILMQPLGAQALIGNEIEPRVALATVRSLEKEISSFRWKGTSELGSLRNDIKDQEHYLFEVLFEPLSKHHRVAIQTGTQPNSPDDSSRAHLFAYNGKQYEALEGRAPSDKNAVIEHGQGTISLELGRSVSHSQFWEKSGSPRIGVSSGIPNLCSFMTTSEVEFFSYYLAEWIENKQIVSITETDKGVWNIVAKVTLWTLPGANNPRTRIELQYDIGKGGVITKQRIVAQQSRWGKVSDEVIMNWDIAFTQNAKKQWVPKSIYRTDQSILRYCKIDFTEFEINPLIEQESFKVDFPDGTYIDDFTSQKYYKIGDPVSEDQAIESFMRYHNLTGNVPAQVRRDYVIVRYALMGIGLALILFALFRIFQNWRKS